MRILITGASRGIGKAIATTFAKRYADQAQITLLARSLDQPSHSQLEGTLKEVVGRLKNYGSRAIPLQVDLKDPNQVISGVQEAIDSMKGLDVLINNASVLYLDPTIKQMDLLYRINTQATLLSMHTAKDALEKSTGSIVTISPPINLGQLEWISRHPEYTISKYSMTLATVGQASDKVRSNCIWPRYTIATPATKRLEKMGWEKAFSEGRPPNDFAEAVVNLAVSNKNSGTYYDDQVMELPKTLAPIDIFAKPYDRHLLKE